MRKLFTTIIEIAEGNIILKEIENYMDLQTSLNIVWESQQGFMRIIINLTDVEVKNLIEGLKETLQNKKYKKEK